MNYLVDLIESKQAAVANNSGAMEADTISKNGRKSKSQMSSINLLMSKRGGGQKLE